MERRAYLRVGAGVAATVGVAGCLGGRGVLGIGDANPDVALSRPEDVPEGADFAYPTWGERVPDVSFPAPIEGGRVAFRDVEEPFFTAFFFTHCQSVCPRLVGALRNVQIHTVQNGHADAVRFLPVTFDPARDDAARLRAYADEMNVATDAGNWTFLRPEGQSAARETVNDVFGLGLRKQSKADGEYMYRHVGLTLLVNADGYVERAYTRTPDAKRLIADLQAVR